LIDLSTKGYSVYPFGLYALKAYLFASHFECEVNIISVPQNTQQDEILRMAEASSPDVIGLSCFVWNEHEIFSLATNARERASAPFILLGGPQIERDSASINQLLRSRIVDAAIVGEGELPLLSVLKSLREFQTPPVNAPSIGMLHEGEVRWGPDAALAKGIDYLPNPYDTLPDLRTQVSRTGVAMYESSRGCPYQCTFCDQGLKAFRTHSIQRIRDDLSAILALRPSTILFLDSTFNVSPARTKEILKFLIDSGNNIHIEAEIKAERCDLEIIDLMRKAGFKSVEVGLQSIKNSTLDFIKRGNKFEQIANAAKMLIAAGIDVNVDTIIGLPGETLEDWLDTIDYCYGLGDVLILSNTLKVLPNTELKFDVSDRGFVLDSTRSFGVVSTDAMSAQDIVEARLHNKMIKLFWNRAPDRSILRTVIDQRFEGRLTHFTTELIELIAQGADKDLLRDPTFWQTHARVRPQVVRPKIRSPRVIYLEPAPVLDLNET
jgi:radical SAM superfamily enzyme YgiQ (UPF0313 family)